MVENYPQFDTRSSNLTQVHSIFPSVLGGSQLLAPELSSPSESALQNGDSVAKRLG